MRLFYWVYFIELKFELVYAENGTIYLLRIYGE
jgi:hypothetical protein